VPNMAPNFVAATMASSLPSSSSHSFFMKRSAPVHSL
jgi:hypothetical protein